MSDNHRIHIMAKTKQITQDQIVDWYMEEQLTADHVSQSIYAFAHKHEFSESEFYKHFNSFEQLEKEIFALFCSKSLELLAASKEYDQSQSKHKLLGFYFTFFEFLTANRSYVVLKLNGQGNHLGTLKVLSGLRQTFLTFAKSLALEPIDFKNETVNRVRDRGVAESLWVQLLMTIKFWLEDESKGFEKTDLFIEKSIKAQFELMDIAPMQSVFDLAKFLWKEKKMA